MTTHDLSIRSVFFNAIDNGTKTFEVRRKRDRTFAVGDRITFLELDDDTNRPTGWQFQRTITYVLDGTDIADLGLIDPDVVILGLNIPLNLLPRPRLFVTDVPPYLKEPSL